MTLRELGDKYYTIKNAHYEVVNSDDAAETLRWVLNTYKLLNDIMGDAQTVKALTATERNVLAQAQDELQAGYCATLGALQERCREDKDA